MRERVDHSPLVQLTLVRLREYLREPEALFWVFLFPVLMALALGIAFRTRGPQPVYAGVQAGPGAAEVLGVLERTSGVEVRALAPAQVEAALRDGDVQVVVVPSRPPAYRFDPTRAESRLARLAVDDALQRAAGRSDRWEAQQQEVVAPGSRYIDWVVPGLLGMNVMATGLWSIGYSIVQMRTRKLLKRLIAAPMRRVQFLAAQIVGRLLFLVLEAATLLLFAWLVFDVRVRGSLAALVVLVVYGGMSFAGLGLLIGSRVRTVEGVSGLINVAMIPMWVLSGVFFSTANFPDAAQPLIKALPLTAFNDALRAVIIEGLSLGRLGLELTILLAWGAISFVTALRVFRWH